jgi:hypothetical protein
MNRLLTLLMILILTLAHGSSLAAAICRHQSGVEHVAALTSGDHAVSAGALSEEAAGKLASKKGAPADSGPVSSPSDMLPAPQLRPPFAASEPMDPSPGEETVLAGASVRPLLEPPSA